MKLTRRSRVRPNLDGRKHDVRKLSSVIRYSTADGNGIRRSDIKRKAIPVFYTVGKDKGDYLRFPKNYCQVIDPNGVFRRVFDFFTVIWVLVLVLVVPFQVGFDWYKLSDAQKGFMYLLDVWFAIDIVLNFRTGFIHHGTVVMDQKKIVK